MAEGLVRAGPQVAGGLLPLGLVQLLGLGDARTPRPVDAPTAGTLALMPGRRCQGLIPSTLAVLVIVLGACERSGPWSVRSHSLIAARPRPPAHRHLNWPSRIIPAPGVVQDIAPTTQALYWLSLPGPPGPPSGSPGPVSPVRYDLASGQVTTAPPLTGLIGSPALTVTGGWVWVAVGQGSEAVVVQFNPATLAVRGEHTLPVKDTLYPPPRPVLTATVGGPLWVAAGEDVWALNPMTGAIESEFNAGNEINSMSTDPTGRLLYTGGYNALSEPGMIVTEYDARNGRQLQRSDQQGAVTSGTVAATSGGVWVSYRGGMAGAALELSATNLSVIAPPPPKITDSPFNAFEQIMGVESSVSDGVLWLTSLTGITCADPKTGKVLASERAGAPNAAWLGPIAAGRLLYAEFPRLNMTISDFSGVVVIAPPTACFGSVTPRAKSLDPADSPTPAAGVCPPWDGPVVNVTMDSVDLVPNPRCVYVGNGQRVSVTNGMPKTITATLGRLTITVPPRQTRAFSAAVGEYLAQGDHRLTLAPYSAGEVWVGAVCLGPGPTNCVEPSSR
jgi:hypothetical protein